MIMMLSTSILFCTIRSGFLFDTAYLGSWVINEAWEGLSVDGKQIFGGFKNLLETTAAENTTTTGEDEC